ncbi:MAG: ABC transporter ATP-binding protein [Actinomycetota bacterium]|nr:ABC transporter ATP-binding protein [Actinomycetota bacterium]
MSRIINTNEPLLVVDDLKVTFNTRGTAPVRAVDGVSFSVRAGETLGVVGESGSGKSVTSLAILGLLPERGVQVEGAITLDGTDLLKASERELQAVRGRRVAMVFQDPMSSLNPVLTIGRQLTEVLRRHNVCNKTEAPGRAAALLDRVGIPEARRRLDNYPHQLSGGMRQRVMIAMALACEPAVLIADEPTTALDVTIQAQVLELLRELVSESNTALILITHDLGVVAGMCDRVHVMYSGRIVESGERHALFAQPRHHYTRGLLASVPRLDLVGGKLTPIPGSPRDVIDWSDGCAFAPRCPAVTEACLGGPPALEALDDTFVRCVNPEPLGESMWKVG